MYIHIKINLKNVLFATLLNCHVTLTFLLVDPSTCLVNLSNSVFVYIDDRAYNCAVNDFYLHLNTSHI